MNKGKDNSNMKVNYVKPAIIDLGSVTAAFGGDTCNSGGTATVTCTGGSVASETCSFYGTSASLQNCAAGGVPIGG